MLSRCYLDAISMLSRCYLGAISVVTGTHHTFTIPSFVVPNGGLALSDIPGTYDIVQFPAIVNHVASQTIGTTTEKKNDVTAGVQD